MKLQYLSVRNFASYAEFDMRFDGAGLALLSGATGSGKSTIPDMVTWTLFGVTAKGGTVDEVRSWLSPDAPTIGVLTVELPSTTITISRIRGKASENDLYWQEDGKADKIRGKDIRDTQKRLEFRLGFDSSLYLSAAYLSEFSSVGSFFMASAKDRRILFEKIANFDLAIKLAERTSDERKEAKKLLAIAERDHAKASGRLESLRESKAKAERDFEAYGQRQKKIIEELEKKFKNFEEDIKEELQYRKEQSDRFEQGRQVKITELVMLSESLSKSFVPVEKLQNQIQELKAKYADVAGQVCPTCGGPACGEEAGDIQEAIALLNEEVAKANKIKRELDRIDVQIKGHNLETNPYTGWGTVPPNQYGEELERQRNAENPFARVLAQSEDSILEARIAVVEEQQKINELEHKIVSLTQLYDLSFELRGEMLKSAVREIEGITNAQLEKYFDAEFTVHLALDGADSLDVQIEKNGYSCAYRQLSKGQRGLLKLSFVTAVMRAASQKAGVHFSTLFFDEALDGLDATLKVKAFGLFQELALEHDNVFIIDHLPEFQSLFDKRFHVEMKEDLSYVTEC